MNLRNLIIGAFIFASTMTFAQQINPITQAMLDGYEQILKENPQDYFTLYQRSAQYYRLSMYDSALNDIEKAISFTPAKEKDMLGTEFSLAADIYIQTEDYNKALNAIENALENSPDSYPYLYQKGNICLHLNDTDEAKKCFAAMQRLQSRSQEAFFGLARVSIMQGNYGEAVSYMTEAENADPSNYVTYCRLGDLCVDMKDYDKAAANYLSAFGLATNQDRPMNSLLKLGKIDYKATANAIDYALTKTSNKVPLYFLKGNIAIENDKLSDAYDAFGQLLDTEEGKAASVYAQMAKVCYALNNMPEAIKYINAALDQALTAPNLLIKSKIDLALGNPNGALADAQNALMADQESVDALTAVALAQIGTKDYDNAISNLTTAIMSDTSNPLPLMIRAYIYNNITGNAREAIADYARVARMQADNFPEIAYKALAQTLSGKKLDGDGTIQMALSNAGNNAEAYYYAAVYYAQTGALQTAKDALIKAMQFGYENDFNVWENNIINLNVAPIRYLLQ